MHQWMFEWWRGPDFILMIILKVIFNIATKVKIDTAKERENEIDFVGFMIL